MAGGWLSWVPDKVWNRAWQLSVKIWSHKRKSCVALSEYCISRFSIPHSSKAPETKNREKSSRHNAIEQFVEDWKVNRSSTSEVTLDRCSFHGNWEGAEVKFMKYNTCSMEAVWTHAKQKKLDPEDHVPHHFIYLKSTEWVNPQWQMAVSETVERMEPY